MDNMDVEMKLGPKKRTEDELEDIYSKLSLKRLEKITEKFLKLLIREENNKNG